MYKSNEGQGVTSQTRKTVTPCFVFYAFPYHTTITLASSQSSQNLSQASTVAICSENTIVNWHANLRHIRALDRLIHTRATYLTYLSYLLILVIAAPSCHSITLLPDLTKHTPIHLFKKFQVLLEANGL